MINVGNHLRRPGYSAWWPGWGYRAGQRLAVFLWPLSRLSVPVLRIVERKSAKRRNQQTNNGDVERVQQNDLGTEPDDSTFSRPDNLRRSVKIGIDRFYVEITGLLFALAEPHITREQLNITRQYLIEDDLHALRLFQDRLTEIVSDDNFKRNQRS